MDELLAELPDWISVGPATELGAYPAFFFGNDGKRYGALIQPTADAMHVRSLVEWFTKQRDKIASEITLANKTTAK